MSRLFTDDHEWVVINGTTATVGISDFALEELGEVVFIEMKDIGTALKKGDEFGSIESVKTVSGLFIPMDGDIVEVNQKIVDSPDIISQSPYDDGWMIKLNITGSIDDLMSEDDYTLFKNAKSSRNN